MKQYGKGKTGGGDYGQLPPQEGEKAMREQHRLAMQGLTEKIENPQRAKGGAERVHSESRRRGG